MGVPTKECDIDIWKWGSYCKLTLLALALALTIPKDPSMNRSVILWRCLVHHIHPAALVLLHHYLLNYGHSHPPHQRDWHWTKLYRVNQSHHRLRYYLSYFLCCVARCFLGLNLVVLNYLMTTMLDPMVALSIRQNRALMCLFFS